MVLPVAVPDIIARSRLVDKDGFASTQFEEFLRGLFLAIAQNNSYVTGSVSTPVGTIGAFWRTTAPDGWLPLTGGTYSRALYPNLFAECGGLAGFGAGDGVTTFQLPNVSDKSMVSVGSLALLGQNIGASTLALTQANLPSLNFPVTDSGHTHTVTIAGQTISIATDPHTHTTTAHSHAVTDPQHTHTTTAHSHGGDAGAGFVMDGAGTAYVSVSGAAGVSAANTADETVIVQSASTGISIDNATVSVQNASVTGSVTIPSATPTTASSTTGVSVSSGGSATPISLYQPSFGVLLCIKY